MKSEDKAGRVDFRKLLSEGRVRWLFIIHALFPASILLFYYNQNSTYVPVRYVLITAAVSMLVSVLIWTLVISVLRNPLAVSILCIVLWTGIFVESLGHSVFLKMFGHIAIFYAFWVLISFALAYILRQLKYISAFSFILCSFVTVFFLLSVVSTVSITVLGFSAQKPEMKTDFNIDVNIADQPNVYWIHCDGMLSFAAIEKYFGDSQDEFREGLKTRGFDIDETANFEANQSTTVAVPALFSPNFYDTYLSDMIHDPSSDHRALTQNAQSILKEVRLNNETINAFAAAGYETNTVALMDQYFFPTTDSFYFPLDTDGCGHFTRCIYLKYPYKLAKLPRLSEEQAMDCINRSEVNTFMLSFFRPGVMLFGFNNYEPEDVFASYSTSAEIIRPVLSDDELRKIFLDGDASVSHSYFAHALSLILDEAPKDKPQFNLLMSIMFHDPYIFDENGKRLESYVLEDANNYHGQHIYAAKVLLNMIDKILEKDPDAVIILQADHGLNAHYEWELDLSFGKGQYDLLELRNSTMSAIRIPENFRNGDEGYAIRNPLNISRYLINRFVGKNYEYLEEDSQSFSDS